MSKRAGITKETLVREYVEAPGVSMEAVCKKLGVCRTTLKKYMERFGVEMIPERQFGHRNTDFPLLRDKAWLEEQLQTRTMQSIAKELGTSSGNVSDHVRRIGLRGSLYNRIEAYRIGLRKRYPNGRGGELASNWRGGKIKSSGGHILAHQPEHPNATQNGYVMEHRLVMEASLGRLLTKDEVVHHRNGIKTDNRPENLQLMTVHEHRVHHLTADQNMYKLERRVEALEAYIRSLGHEPPAGHPTLA